jgi:hypothetical protein
VAVTSYEQGGYGYKVFIEKQPVMNDLFEDYRMMMMMKTGY